MLEPEVEGADKQREGITHMLINTMVAVRGSVVP